MKWWHWIVVGILVLLLLVGLSAAVAPRFGRQPQPTSQTASVSALTTQQNQACGLTAADTLAVTQRVTLTGLGPQPATAALKVGQTVRWVNNDTVDHQIASAPHPQHTTCLGLLSPQLHVGDGYAFTFTKAGTWRYHEEENPTITGEIVVTE